MKEAEDRFLADHGAVLVQEAERAGFLLEIEIVALDEGLDLAIVRCHRERIEFHDQLPSPA